MIELDGAELTGGGQIIRCALALSAHTNKPFRITNIRAGRPRPGLMAQHLAAVKTLRRLCNADVEGMQQGSTELMFRPRGFTPEPLDIHIGTAGSATLLLQALAVPAMHHKKTKYTIHGGTDVRWSPPIDYLRYLIAPALQAYGEMGIDLKRRGYYPQGGGEVEATLGKRKEPSSVNFTERGSLEGVTLICHAARSLMDKQVCEDIERYARLYLDDLGVPLTVRNEYVSSLDDGYGVLLYATHNLGGPRSLIGADILGDEAASPQDAAERVARALKERLASSGAVDEHVADHLIPFMALHGGEITVTRVSGHVRAAIAVAERFTGARFSIEDGHITVSRPYSSDASSISV